MTHKWSEPVTYPYKTERVCLRPGCTVVKVTRHEPGQSWREFWSDGEKFNSDRTPPCTGEIEVAAI